jgi:Protein of unknown function (DUF5661)
MTEKTQFTVDEAKDIGNSIGIDWQSVDLEQFRMGLAVEMEHSGDSETDVTRGDRAITGKIAWAHLKEYRDYYSRLARMEAEAERDWAEQAKQVLNKRA